MNEDLEFRHEGSMFTVCCSFYKYMKKREIINVGITLDRSIDLCYLPSRDNVTVAQFQSRCILLKVKYKLYFLILNQTPTLSALIMFDI